MSEAGDAGVAAMVQARSGSATLKHGLLTLRGRCPSALIFVFEGVDDKIPYRVWTRQLRPELDFEVFQCKGKGNVLLLRAAVERDANDLKTGVFFFVDRDFDDLRGEPPSANLFMTERYSFENYLVVPRVVDLLLSDVFHCENPAERQRIVLEFERLYAQFLLVTRNLNKRLFVSKRAKVLTTKVLPDKVSKIASVHLTDVQPAATPETEVVRLERELDDVELREHTPAFESLPAEERYRGKFALMFFLRWLQLLGADRAAPTPAMFECREAGAAKCRLDEIRISLLASYAEPPERLSDFLRTMPLQACV